MALGGATASSRTTCTGTVRFSENLRQNGFLGATLLPMETVVGQRRKELVKGGVMTVRASEGKQNKPPVFILNVKPERKPLPLVEDNKPLLSLENYDFQNLVVDPNHRSGNGRPLRLIVANVVILLKVADAILGWDP
jgi:hypothetical protein